MKPSRMSGYRAGQNTFTISVDTSSLNALLDQLGDDAEAAVRPAAQAGAQVLYEEVRKNVQRIGKKTGNLLNSIYQAFSASNSGPGKAAYHIGWRTSGAGVRAPHGHLLEYDHIQRYAAYIGKDGKWYTAVRPSMRGRPKPSRRASQSVKDAYYVPRKGGPVQIAGKRFVRNAASKFPQALDAAEAKLLEILNGKK
jgi:hypothetical protein